MSFWSQNVLSKYFFYPWFLGWVAPESGFLLFCVAIPAVADKQPEEVLLFYEPH